MNKKDILEALGGIPEEVYDSIVQSFYEETKARMPKFLDAVKAHDSATVAKIGHSIKGSAANLRLDEISALGKKIESSGKSNEVQSFQALYDQLLSLIS